MRPTCPRCHRDLEPDDYCYGCEEHVCRRCATNEEIVGMHFPEDHYYQDTPEQEALV